MRSRRKANFETEKTVIGNKETNSRQIKQKTVVRCKEINCRYLLQKKVAGDKETDSLYIRKIRQRQKDKLSV